MKKPKKEFIPYSNYWWWVKSGQEDRRCPFCGTLRAEADLRSGFIWSCNRCGWGWSGPSKDPYDDYWGPKIRKQMREFVQYGWLDDWYEYGEEENWWFDEYEFEGAIIYYIVKTIENIYSNINKEYIECDQWTDCMGDLAFEKEIDALDDVTYHELTKELDKNCKNCSKNWLSNS